MFPEPPRRRRRADAVHNRARLLAEAEAAFRAHGTEAALDPIARRAGVTIRTLQRHYPSRRSLIAAVLREHTDEVAALADDLAERMPAWQALAGWSGAAVRYAARYRGLPAHLIGGAADDTSELHPVAVQLTAAGGRLLTLAGNRHPAEAATDLFELVTATAWLHESVSADQAQRLLLHGLTGIGTRERLPAGRRGRRGVSPAAAASGTAGTRG